MDSIQALLLAVVEGITEFLPVSSTGHLILASHLLGIPETEFVKSFEIIIQLGAVLAIVILYWKKFFDFKKGVALNKKVWLNVMAAFIPTAIVGLILYKFIKSVLLGNELITVLALLIGGILLIILEKMITKRHSGNPHTDSLSNITIKQSFLIGLAQSLSVIPGVSRSAASILGAMFLGVNRQTAVEFSFLLAIPTMMAATGLDLIKSDFNFSSDQWTVLVVGFVGSFIVAILVVKWFVKFVQTNTFIPFGIYRIVIALLYWVMLLK